MQLKSTDFKVSTNNCNYMLSDLTSSVSVANPYISVVTKSIKGDARLEEYWAKHAIMLKYGTLNKSRELNKNVEQAGTELYAGNFIKCVNLSKIRHMNGENWLLD